MDYETTEQDRQGERSARDSFECPACGREKGQGPLVCWGECWRGRHGLKNSLLTFSAWMRQRTPATPTGA